MSNNNTIINCHEPLSPTIATNHCHKHIQPGDQVPADALQCRAAFKCKSERLGMKCWCTSENCNKNTTMPTNCEQANPENGADGKVGAVLSIVLSAIFATIF